MTEASFSSNNSAIREQQETDPFFPTSQFCFETFTTPPPVRVRRGFYVLICSNFDFGLRLSSFVRSFLRSFVPISSKVIALFLHDRRRPIVRGPSNSAASATGDLCPLGNVVVRFLTDVNTRARVWNLGWSFLASKVPSDTPYLSSWWIILAKFLICFIIGLNEKPTNFLTNWSSRG